MANMPTAEIPYGCYWSTPFFKWQGKVQNLHSLKFAAWVAKRELEKRNIPLDQLSHGVLGLTVPQQDTFYGMPWLAGQMGAEHLTGPSIAQACATGTRCLLTAQQEIATGMTQSTLVITADRTSNGPHLYYPNTRGPGGTGAHEDWVMDSFASDPNGGHPMVVTAENVASRHGISMEEQHTIVLRRYEQYQDALADECSFQKRYMSLPFDIPAPNFKKISDTALTDEGITAATVEGLAGLRPVVPEGSVTYGSQTHPADGNAGLIMASSEVAKEFSKNPDIAIQVLSFGQSRCELAYMPEATVPAAQAALDRAGVTIDQLDAIKTHNPFAVNDIVFARKTGADVMKMNNYGCSLVFGHPQGVTSLRSVIELIEELVTKGGGTGLFVGCSAGDSSMATVIRVEDRSRT
jgi:acetyl-CoA acetyltransferase